MINRYDTCEKIAATVSDLREYIDAVVQEPFDVSAVLQHPRLSSADNIPSLFNYIDLSCGMCAHCLDFRMLAFMVADFLNSRRAYLTSMGELDKMYMATIKESGCPATADGFFALAWKKTMGCKFSKTRLRNLRDELESKGVDIEKFQHIIAERKDLYETIKQARHRLRSEFIAFQLAEAQDDILANITKGLPLQEFCTAEVDLPDCAKTVYFDQHIYDEYKRGERFFEAVESSKKTERIVCLYSPYTVEEAIKHSCPAWIEDFLDTIRAATGNHIILKTTSGLRIMLEDPEYSKRRAALLYDGTRSAERLNEIKHAENKLMFPHFFYTTTYIKDQLRPRISAFLAGWR